MNDLPPRADVAIIGGGFAGCATAWGLRSRGIRAVVLEREPELGRYASGRGAGVGRQIVEDDDTTALTVRGAAQLRGPLSAAWSASGGVLSFDDPARAEAYVSRARRFEVAVERIDPAAVRAWWPALDRLPIAVALWVPGDGVIDTKRLLASYADGLELVRDVTVERAIAGSHGARLATSRGSLDVAVVVDAAGAWAGEATGGAPLDVYRRHLFVIEAATTSGVPYVWHLGASELYARRDGGGVLISPCDAVREAPADVAPDPDASELLGRLLDGSAPAWANAPIAKTWACQRSFTSDRRMRLGRDPSTPWLVWAAGLGGHGATASPAVGEVVADAVVAALG